MYHSNDLAGLDVSGSTTASRQQNANQKNFGLIYNKYILEISIPSHYSLDLIFNIHGVRLVHSHSINGQFFSAMVLD